MKQKKYDYATAHNKAVTLYQKCSMVIFFIALLNITGAITGCFNRQNTLHFFPSLVSNVLIFRLLSNLSLNIIVNSILNVAISIGFGAIFAWLWYMAKRGKILAIYFAFGLYLLDVIIMFIFFRGEGTFMTQLLLHLLIIGFLIAAVMFYYQVLDIEKKFKKKG